MVPELIHVLPRTPASIFVRPGPTYMIPQSAGVLYGIGRVVKKLAKNRYTIRFSTADMLATLPDLSGKLDPWKSLPMIASTKDEEFEMMRELFEKAAKSRIHQVCAFSMIVERLKVLTMTRYASIQYVFLMNESAYPEIDRAMQVLLLHGR